MMIGSFSLKYHCKIEPDWRAEAMDEMKYAVLTEVLGRGKAEILESLLRSEEIDVVLVQEAISHVTHVTSFAPVKIYVPKVSMQRARNLLKQFNEAQAGQGENEDGE
jgi:hypothetical protein